MKCFSSFLSDVRKIKRLNRDNKENDLLDEDDDGGDEETSMGEVKSQQLELKPSGSKFGFLEEQLRRLRSPRFGEVHHKRVPTPLKKRRPRNIRLEL
ncbi:hypothetical protein RUM43_012545 [Polyplax serrata]|uniref:Uncharacterized protein n=1 Tax=Polyplax serrata TaxID=468196 RepID=A0AAN8RZG5_POLSC